MPNQGPRPSQFTVIKVSMRPSRSHGPAEGPCTERAIRNAVVRHNPSVGGHDYSEKTIKELFALSGNQCSFPGCTHSVIDALGNVVAQIVHIKGVGTSAARHDPTVSGRELAAPANLMVMCYAHHKATDDEVAYPVARLQQIKREHERRFGGLISGLRARVADKTSATVIRPPQNLGRYNAAMRPPLPDDEVERLRRTIAEALERLASLPPDARSILAVLCERGQTSTQHPDRISMPVDTLRQLLDIEAAELGKVLETLTYFGYAYVDDAPTETYFNGPWVHLETPWRDYPETFLLEVDYAHRELGIPIQTLLVDLNWQVLDFD